MTFDDQLPKERGQFKKLLAVNPNYFGNLSDSVFEPVVEMVGNSAYEELTCVGFNPDLRLLEGTIHIKLPSGYGGDLCSAGSREYVRFFLDYGSGWSDVGLAGVSVHDLTDSKDCHGQPDKPLTYVVSLPIEPDAKTCVFPVLPKVRAILSWEVIPAAGDPDWHPIWGSVLESHIQIKPRPWTIFDLAVKWGSDVPLELVSVQDQPIPAPDPAPLPVADLVAMYEDKASKGGTSVKAHRFGLSEIHAMISVGAVQQEAIATTIDDWKQIGLDWSKIAGKLVKTSGDVSYEELNCIGLDYHLERAVATFQVKRKNGYSGELCTAGSNEYVAFWADWDDDCDWTYLGTVSVRTHDFHDIPDGGLSYSAVLPVDLSAVRRPCKAPKVGRLRAVLSWGVAPSTSDPDAVPHWGNLLDAHVQIRPGIPFDVAQPIISAIGGIGLDDIDVFVDGYTKPPAHFVLGGSPADAAGRKCPFGGLIVVQGFSSAVFTGMKYRLWIRDATAGTSPVPVKDDVWITNWLGMGSWHKHDPAGPGNPNGDFFSYVDPMNNIDNVLSHFHSSGDHVWELQLELADAGYNSIGWTPSYKVQLDNSGPVRKDPNNPSVIPTIDIWIDTGGGDCADFLVNTTVGGRFVARDPNFGGFSLTTLPNSLNPPPPNPSSGSTQTPAFPTGAPWSVDMGNQPCGYVMLLQVWDRSIVGSRPGSHNSNYTDVGFCLRKG
jgi:hypothetical protein